MTKLKLTTMMIGFILVCFFVAYAMPASQKLSDATIKTLIEKRLAKEGIPQSEVTVSVTNGTVILDGKVDCVAKKLWAFKAAQASGKADQIQNNIMVDAGNRNDQEIANDVAKAIRTSVFFDIFDWIDGQVDNGVVSLTGYVREPWRQTDYERLVQRVKGVKDVVMKTEVLPVSPYDDRLRISAARKIYHNPIFIRYADRAYPPIHIIVRNGNIILKGVVANQLEKQVAGTLIRSGVLALGVENDLSVESRTKHTKI